MSASKILLGSKLSSNYLLKFRLLKVWLKHRILGLQSSSHDIQYDTKTYYAANDTKMVSLGGMKCRFLEH